MRIFNKNAGVSTLPTILLLGSIIIEIAIAVAFLAYYFNNINFSARLSSEALEAARAGANDAIRLVIGDKTCPDANCPSGSGQPSYTVIVNNRLVNVTLSHATPPCSPDPANPATTQTVIDSVGVAGSQNRKVEAQLSVDCATGQVTTTAFNEISL